jgi:hypothetical protein
MQREWPRVRLIAVLRDPIDRAISAYFHYMRYGMLPVLPIEQGLARLMEGQIAPEWPRATEVLDFGKYGSAVAMWLTHFAPSALLILDSTELRRDPATTLGRASDHLGIGTAETTSEIRDGMPGSYGMGHVRARRVALPLLYARQPGGRITARSVLPQMYDRAERLLWRDRTPPPRLSDGLRLRLHEFYEGEVRRLLTVIPSDQHPEWADRYR